MSLQHISFPRLREGRRCRWDVPKGKLDQMSEIEESDFLDFIRRFFSRSRRPADQIRGNVRSRQSAQGRHHRAQAGGRRGVWRSCRRYLVTLISFIYCSICKEILFTVSAEGGMAWWKILGEFALIYILHYVKRYSSHSLQGVDAAKKKLNDYRKKLEKQLECGITFFHQGKTTYQLEMPDKKKVSSQYKLVSSKKGNCLTNKTNKKQKQISFYAMCTCS